MSKKFNVSRKNTNLKKGPPPQNNGSVMGNVAGGMASGFGVGTGIEAARGIFGSNQNNTETNVTKDNDGCQILSEMITKCKEKNDGFNDCNDLLEMFSNKCLSK